VLPPDAGKARRTWCRAGWVDQVFLWVLRVLLGWGACGAGLGVCWEILWVLGLFLVGLFGFSFCGLALVVPVYTPGVLKGALRFFIKFSYLSKKKLLIAGVALMLSHPVLLHA
jgi:hypothetical protein